MTAQMPVVHSGKKNRRQRSFSTMMVLVGGLPGTGKTYFSLRLSEMLNATHINSDLMREEMDAQGEYAFGDKLTVYEEMARRIAEEVRQGKGVIVDATFYCRQMREIFFTLAKLMHLKLVFFEIVADEKVVRRRLRGMESPEAELSVYNFVKAHYEQPDIDHLVIESKEDNIDDMLEKAIDYISKVSCEMDPADRLYK